jgi:hypothetical protein
MRRITFLIILAVAAVVNAFSSAIIAGSIRNAKSKFVELQYLGSSSAYPNYYGPSQLCSLINENCEFKIRFETSNDYCQYILYFNSGKICFDFVIKNNDRLNLIVDLNNLDSTFIVKGEGSGFANYEFARDIIMPHKRPILSDEEIITYWENRRLSDLNLLKSFRNGHYINVDSLSDKEVVTINRLIKNTNLNSNEYEIIQNRLNYYITSAIRMTSFDYLLTHIDKYYNLYNNIDLSKNYILNDCTTSGLSEYLVRLSCYKKYIDSTGSMSHNFADYFETSKNVLKGDLLQKYMADYLYDLMISGKYKDYEEYLNRSKGVLTNIVYISKLNSFYNNYLGALDNKEFNLNSPDKQLNDSSVKLILNSYKGQKVYLIVWKISSETSYTLTPLFKLTKLNLIQALQKNKNIKFIDICLGDDSIKPHWASMIINHNWKGNHYFYSSGDKKDFRKKLNCGDKMQYCSGELYYLLDENGKIEKDNSVSIIEELK